MTCATNSWKASAHMHRYCSCSPKSACRETQAFLKQRSCFPIVILCLSEAGRESRQQPSPLLCRKSRRSRCGRFLLLVHLSEMFTGLVKVEPTRLHNPRLQVSSYSSLDESVDRDLSIDYDNFLQTASEGERKMEETETKCGAE